MQKLLLAESLLQRNVLALIKLILGSRTERRALIETLVVCDQMSSTFVSVQKRNVIVVQLLLRGNSRKLVCLSSFGHIDGGCSVSGKR